MENFDSIRDFQWVKAGEVANLEFLESDLRVLFTQDSAKTSLAVAIGLLKEIRDGGPLDSDDKVEKLGAGLFLR